MLQGVGSPKAEVGLFTVIKKAALNEQGELEVALRLVFGERLPNQLWNGPPWVALAGPGAFAAIDLSEAAQETPR